jgi:LemA protein
MAALEAYPTLRARGNVAQLHDELTSTENRISFARQLYNDTATLYNTRQSRFPANVVAGMAGASRVDLWELTDPTQRGTPVVDLSLKPVDRSNS